MILYLDTSALVKAYVKESHSTDVMKAIKKAKIIACHVVGFVEAHSTFSRAHREKKLSSKEFDTIKNEFTQDWNNYLQVECTQPLLQKAADFAEAFSLRAYDSIHLAAADFLAKQSKKHTLFGCFDQQLNKAAIILGMDLPNFSEWAGLGKEAPLNKKIKFKSDDDLWK